VSSTVVSSRATGSLVAGLDAGGSLLKAWVAEVGGRVLAQVSVPTPTLRPAPDRAEFDPATWEAAARDALAQVVTQVPGTYVGVTACSLRQGFVLLDASGRPLGNGVLNSDRTGAAYQQVLAGRHDLTGHWPAPELTLPKLLAVQAGEPDRWASTRKVLFVHDWLLWRAGDRDVVRLCGRHGRRGCAELGRRAAAGVRPRDGPPLPGRGGRRGRGPDDPRLGAARRPAGRVRLR